MPTPPRWFVWEWVDENGAVRFLGKGCQENNEHPAAVLWDKRREMNSPLGQWLCSLKTEPARSDKTISQAMYETNAMALYTQRLRFHKKHDANLLTTRLHGSYAGGGARCGVISPDLDIYVSVRQAALDKGVSPATISRYCQESQKTGWHLVNQDS